MTESVNTIRDLMDHTLELIIALKDSPDPGDTLIDLEETATRLSKLLDRCAVQWEHNLAELLKTGFFKDLPIFLGNMKYNSATPPEGDHPDD